MTLQADANGKLVGQFTVPTGIPEGAKKVSFLGNQGTLGDATFVGNGSLEVTTLRRVTQVVTRRWDPLAQTFTLNQSRHISGCDLWFKQKGALQVQVQIREAENGLPNQNVLATGYLEAEDINLNDTSTRVTWEPVYLHADREYAVVILTDDADHAVAIAKLGKYDNSRKSWITEQPYQVGVLLSSSNASTWTPHQDMDLTFRLLSADFTETSKTIDLGSFDASDVTDLMTMALVERTDSSTDIVWVLKSETDDTEEYRLKENTPLNLRGNLTGSYRLFAEITGTNTSSPILFPNVQAILGTLRNTADYISRAVMCGDNAKITVRLDVILSGQASVDIFYEDNGEWIEMVLDSADPVGDDWEERTYIVNGISTPETRVKIVLNGSAADRPRARNLRMVITDAE